jgi:hydroxymethylglutaryl-CoA lyase
MQGGMTDKIKIVEVGPRDGLQNEARPVDVATRVALVERLADAGLPVVEAGAFVAPKWVPQMAGSADVFAAIKRRDGVDYPALVPNQRGLDAALAADVKTIAIFLSASETFSERNINCTIAESYDRIEPVVAAALAAGIGVRGYISCVVGCPYEGAIAADAVASVAGRLADMGIGEISLGDTVGVGTPGSIGPMLTAVRAAVGADVALAGHYHDTYGQALANIVCSLDHGLRIFDASVAGLGGCPYAPGAGGNVASEDVVYLLHGMGFDTGVDLDALVAVGDWICRTIDRSNQSKTGRALLAKHLS